MDNLDHTTQRLTAVIEVYRDTLVPASLVGLFSKLAGLLLSGHIGGLVDSTHRLRFVRIAIGSEKILNTLNYGLFLILFGPLRAVAQDAFHGNASWQNVAAVWAIISFTVIFSSISVLANTGLIVAVERDWVVTIAQGEPRHLTLLNTSVRRIDLFSKLVAPVSNSTLPQPDLTPVVRLAADNGKGLQFRDNCSPCYGSDQLRRRVLVG